MKDGLFTRIICAFKSLTNDEKQNIRDFKRLLTHKQFKCEVRPWYDTLVGERFSKFLFGTAHRSGQAQMQRSDELMDPALLTAARIGGEAEQALNIPIGVNVLEHIQEGFFNREVDSKFKDPKCKAKAVGRLAETNDYYYTMPCYNVDLPSEHIIQKEHFPYVQDLTKTVNNYLQLRTEPVESKPILITKTGFDVKEYGQDIHEFEWDHTEPINAIAAQFTRQVSSHLKPDADALGRFQKMTKKFWQWF